LAKELRNVCKNIHQAIWEYSAMLTGVNVAQPDFEHDLIGNAIKVSHMGRRVEISPGLAGLESKLGRETTFYVSIPFYLDEV
jgi:hypothetical protein